VVYTKVSPMPLVKSPTLTAEYLALILYSKRPDAPSGRARGGRRGTGSPVMGLGSLRRGRVFHIWGWRPRAGELYSMLASSSLGLALKRSTMY
jgi:hypothetical protein